MLLFNLDVIVSVGLCDVCVWCIANVLARIEWILGCKWQHRKAPVTLNFPVNGWPNPDFFFVSEANLQHPPVRPSVRQSVSHLF